MAENGPQECPFCDEELREEEKEAHLKEGHAERVCSVCAQPLDTVMPYDCSHCERTFCQDHRLPEKHDCSGLGDPKDRLKQSENVSYMDDKAGREGKEEKEEPAQPSHPSVSYSAPKLNIVPRARRMFRRRSVPKKAIPLVGLVLLGWIFYARSSNRGMVESVTEPSWSGLLMTAMSRVESALVNLNAEALGITALIVLTLWTGYKYWLRDYRYIRRSRTLLEKVVIVLIFVVIVERHVLLDTVIGRFADYAVFLAFLYLELAGTWMVAKTIDSINLASDLYLWGLRILGGVLMFFGAVVFVSGSMTLSLSGSDAVTQNIIWIAGICIMLLGAFMNYRSVRRAPAIHVW